MCAKLTISVGCATVSFDRICWFLGVHPVFAGHHEYWVLAFFVAAAGLEPATYGL